MITYYLIILFVSILKFVVSPLLLLQDVSIPAFIASSLAVAGNTLALFDLILPLSTLFTVVGLVVGVETAYFGYKGIKWLYNKIPGIN